MKSRMFLRVISLFILLVSFIPASSTTARAAAIVPPADMFQLPWEQGLAWVSLDVFDNGFKRPTSSPHYYLNGGAIDFAPRKNMVKGEDTSRYWVTAAAGGTVISMTSCSLKIDHANGWVSDYQFLANFQVKVGDIVYRNQKLGIIADGVRNKFCPPAVELDIPHLHFSLRPTMRDATFAGWTVNYNTLFNRTTFTKGDVTVGQYQPLLNVFDGLQIVDRGALPWDAAQTGSVDTFRYERWSLTLSETTKFTLTATPNTTNLVPLLVLTDANGTELARSADTLTTTQAAGNYFVQVQPQVANGFYSLIAHKEEIPVPTGPYVSTTAIPTSIDVGSSALVAVSLHNIPAEGYTSTEFTCTYNAGISEISNITMLSTFGADPVYVVNGPQNGSFILAIAGSNGNRAVTDGNVFTFDIRGLQAGQTALECQARVSKGDNLLSSIEWLGTVLNIKSIVITTPTPGVSPVPPTSDPGETPSPTETSQFPPPTPTGSLTPAPVESFTPTGTTTVDSSFCDQAEFIANITIPTGTVVQPGAVFTKTWRVRNIGTCNWTTAYQFVFFSGEQMSVPAIIQFPANIAVGQTVDITLNMTAPSTPGSYQGNWMFKNANGALFGTGPQATRPLHVDIVVSTSTATPSATPLPPGNDWLTFTNIPHGFQFKYPPQGVIAPDGDDFFSRIDLPFVQGTNLREKYLEVFVVGPENCRSPLAILSNLETSDIVVINGLTFLKQTGGDAGAGNIHEWVAYSTLRDDVCVIFDFILHSLNAGNFPTPPPVFDYDAETAVFDQMISTFAWLAQTPTATPTPSLPGETPAPTITTTPSLPGDTPAPTFTSTPGGFDTPTPSGDGTVTGKVIALKPATIGMYDEEGALVTSLAANPGDTFSITAPAGTYTLVAVAHGYLSAEGSVTLTGGSTITQPDVELVPGDVDNNDVIDQFDAMSIGMNYNSSTFPPADLNNDNIVNVLDLEILARNYRQTGPIPWE